MKKNNLLTQAPAVLNIGIDGFNDSVTQNGGTLAAVEWQPPGNADPELAWQLAQLMGDERIEAANAKACQQIMNARPMWEDMALRADGVIPELKGARLLLHAGPPVNWRDMCGPMHGAMVGAVLYEGWAKNESESGFADDLQADLLQ